MLAVVAAETRHAAREAAALIEVEYEVLEPVTDPFDALADGAPTLHEGGNVLSVSRVQRGDVDAALAASAHVVSRSFRTQLIEHAFLEPESAFAVPEQGGPLHVYSQGQGIWDDRRQIASFLGLPEEQVRVTQVSTGGAFGAKEDLERPGPRRAARDGDGPAGAASRCRARRASASTPSATRCGSTTRSAATTDGQLTALRARIVGDTGAYASVGDKVLERAAGHACSAYERARTSTSRRRPSTRTTRRAARCAASASTSRTSPWRACSTCSPSEVGIDGWEIRWRNALDVGDRFGTGQKLGPGVGAEADAARRPRRLPRRALRRASPAA